MKIKQTFIAIFCFLTVSLMAQDMQYSYWQFSPISYNPAFTGAFYGNLRLNGMVRDQWRNVSVNEYQTLSLSFDGNIPFGFKENHWLSAGMSLVKDKAGASNYKHSFQGLSLAYHMPIGKKENTIITLGGKYGSYTKAFSKEGLETNFMFDNPGGNDIDIAGLAVDENGNITNDVNDLMIGVMLFTNLGKTSALRFGVASDHLLEPDIRVQQDTTGTRFTEEIERRFNIHAQLYFDINEKLTFNPTVLYQKMGPASNMLVQGLMSYAFDAEKEIYLNAGVGLRLSDNSFIPLYFGADIKDWKFGASYSINMGGLSQAAAEGGFELAASKVFSWNKKAKVNPKFICPRL